MGNRPSDSFTLVSAGDCIVGKDISRTPGFAAVRKLIHQGDCAIGNLESVLMDSASLAATMRTFPFSGCLVGSPAVAADLRRSGFHVLSRANNHATDFGPDGIHMTDRALDAAGLRYAGVGGNRSLAQAPCFVDCQHGRVALISATSTYTQGASATAPLDRNPSRPGIQTLRVHRFSLVNRNELCMLRRLRDEQPAGSVLIPNPDPVDEVELFGIRYRAGDVRGFHYAMEPADVRELLESIERARYCADYVVLSMHSHEPGNWSEVPADFFTVLARQAIDHGADVITGHGPHRLRGIEIYRNRPIFYSLGNFICQAALLDPMVADKYEQHRQWDSAVSDELAALWLSLIVDDVWYQSVLATTRFLDRKMTEIQLTPLELRSDAAGGVRGVPRVARDKKASTILRTLQRLSNCLGTRLCIQNDLGFIHPIAGDPPSRPR